jgi:hypothetical protein
MNDFNHAFAHALADQREAEELLAHPTMVNLMLAYVLITKWAKHWSEHWPDEEGRQIWRDSLAATKPHERRLMRAMSRFGERHGLFKIIVPDEVELPEVVS